MDITPATPDDADAIASVHVRSWQAAYAGILAPAFLAGLSIPRRADQWRDILARRESHTAVARSAAGVTGFISFGAWRAEDAGPTQGEVWALYAQPESWGQGVGKALLQWAVQALRADGRHTVLLWVLRRNQRGLRFYRSCGFEEVADSAQLFDLGGTQVEEICLRLDHR
jgi:GNAT superfamily N-acetyltransferase